ncbi:MAG: Uma2 family endonuclease [Defluviitaleaceae bacterium]|nr:Uma2 family endonuclease [Defluviitaleaceae bacterium]
MSALPSHIKQNKNYTLDDLNALPQDVWAELINGQLYVLDTPAAKSVNLPSDIHMMAMPSSRHQAISGEISRQIGNHLLGKGCRVFAPLSVQLDENDETTVNPDIVVICDRSKIKPAGCVGTPDLIIEILSPSNRQHDKIIKYLKYLNAGVPEYWIVDPSDNTVTVHRLLGKQYTAVNYNETHFAPVACLSGFEVDLSLVFAGEAEIGESDVQ